VKSGEVPPNPSELLIAPRMQHLIDTVKASFDYIIIDTPPIGAFSDSVVLLKYADLSICVVRQNHTTRPLLDNLNELHQNNPHIKMALLFNYVDMKKAGRRLQAQLLQRRILPGGRQAVVVEAAHRLSPITSTP
jgi:Flp pilus assembly CpaE family ATPase